MFNQVRAEAIIHSIMEHFDNFNKVIKVEESADCSHFPHKDYNLKKQIYLVLL